PGKSAISSDDIDPVLKSGQRELASKHTLEINGRGFVSDGGARKCRHRSPVVFTTRISVTVEQGDHDPPDRSECPRHSRHDRRPATRYDLNPECFGARQDLYRREMIPEHFNGSVIARTVDQERDGAEQRPAERISVPLDSAPRDGIQMPA